MTRELSQQVNSLVCVYCGAGQNSQHSLRCSVTKFGAEARWQVPGSRYAVTDAQIALAEALATVERERDAALATVKRLQDQLARHLAPDVQRDAELDHLAALAAAGNEREKTLEADLERAREAVRLCLPHAPTVTAIRAAKLAFGDQGAPDA